MAASLAKAGGCQTIRVVPFAQGFPFAYLGRAFVLPHGIGDSVFCTVWADHVKKNRFLVLGWFGVSWVRLVVVPVLGSIGVSRVLFLLVACAGVHVRRGASLMIYYYINIIIFIYLSSVVKIKHKNIKHINTRVRK